MVDGCEIDEFYSALEVAEIKGLTKQAIIDGCKKGKYQGAVKSQPDRTNKQGLWLIPKSTIDNPTTDFTPATQPQNLEEIKKDFHLIISEEINKYADDNRQQQLSIARAAQKRHDEMIDILMRQSLDIQRLRAEVEKSWWKKILGLD